MSVPLLRGVRGVYYFSFALTQKKQKVNPPNLSLKIYAGFLLTRPKPLAYSLVDRFPSPIQKSSLDFVRERFDGKASLVRLSVHESLLYKLKLLASFIGG